MLSDHAMTVLELFTAERPEVGVVEAAELLGRPKSTVSGWLSSLAKAGFLDREPASGRYRLGIRLATLGERARRSTSLRREAKPHLEELTRRTRETSSVNVLIGAEVVNTAVVESPRPILAAGGLGIPMPIHATAAGKALVAWRPEGDVRRLLPPRLETFTPNAIQDVETFLEALGTVRERGYAVAMGELADQLYALSAPVRDSTGRVIGALSVAAPLARVSDTDAPPFTERVVAAAAAVSRALGYGGAEE